MKLTYISLYLDVPTAEVIGNNLGSPEPGITEPDRKKIKKQVQQRLEFLEKWASQPRDSYEWAEYIQERDQLFREDNSEESFEGKKGETPREGTETEQEQEPLEKDSEQNGGIEETAF